MKGALVPQNHLTTTFAMTKSTETPLHQFQSSKLSQQFGGIF